MAICNVINRNVLSRIFCTTFYTTFCTTVCITECSNTRVLLGIEYVYRVP